MLIFVGLPLFFLEFAFGQFASLGPISIWNVSPLFKAIKLRQEDLVWKANSVLSGRRVRLLQGLLPSLAPWFGERIYSIMCGTGVRRRRVVLALSCHGAQVDNKEGAVDATQADSGSRLGLTGLVENNTQTLAAGKVRDTA
ncbi:unnamed protein product [Dibothriocephalus latus]|uniref:Methionyl/Valyl/Leucyl/Isoleucyl-tRNA synthetase anticodon-binding domain-containing protein n=1 Tax=Dibothriocephalus latus TaxID=60516 RepID=A0A3P7LID8_DIBLA|nr:unnamed protein product [Dibothriocephalus latus]